MVHGTPLISSPPPTGRNQSSLAHNWNLVVFVIGMFCFNIDPFFFYLRKDCGSTSTCIDIKLGVFLAILRTLGDVCFLCIKGVTPHKTTIPDSPPRLKLVKEPNDIVHRNNLNATFIINLAATIPLPQILVWNKIRTSDTYVSSKTSHIMSLIILGQLPFRAVAMNPVSRKTFKMSSILMRNAWTGAMLNLMYFMVVSHIWGALYYDMYVSKLINCKHTVSETEDNAATHDWDQLLAVCTQRGNFEIGMFTDAFTTKITTRSFTQKYVYCLSWGLKSLSSFGQIFSASSWAVETILSFLTVVFGLILFGDLLAQMQSGLQSTEDKEGRQRTRQRMVEEWMKYHQLPTGLKRRVKQAIQCEWSATKGMNGEAILDSLPWDVRCDVRRQLYLDIVHNLPPFVDMDNHLVGEICGHLRTFSGNEGAFIAFEGEPIRQMIFIYSGELEVSYANRCGQHSVILGPGELCGQELLEWCSFPTKSTENLPSSTRTIKCITDVDAFSLVADDVKLLAIQFHRDGKFRQAFQHYVA